MEFLKVTAHLLDGRVNSYDGLFQLDSLLAYAWMFENHPDELQNNHLTPETLIRPDLPLERRDGRWSASAGFYIQHTELTEHWHKRPNDADAADYADFGTRRGKIDTASGDYKAYRIPQVIRLTGPIEFYCTGDAAEVRRLLTTITNIGKKAAQGYGHVREWSVETTSAPLHEKGPYGIMRPTPFRGDLPDDGETYEIRKIRTEPPYHLHTERVPCIIPNVRRKRLA